MQSRICAMELDHEYQALSVFKNNKDDLQNEALYVLDEDGIVHELIANTDGTHENTQQIDFSDHDLEDIIADDWGRAHINKKGIIYKEIIYLRNQVFSDGTRSKVKKFNWHQLKPIVQEHFEIQKTSDDPGPLIYVESTNNISAMLAIEDTYSL